MREERGEEAVRNAVAESKARDLSSHNGSSNGHSPVLNLSKSGGMDQNSAGDHSDRSDDHSSPPSVRDDDGNISDDNVSEVDERDDKDDGK